MSETISLTPFNSAPPPAPVNARSEQIPTGFDHLGCEVIAPSSFPVTLTQRAIDMVRAALDETNGEEGEYLRVGVKGGGCSGFQYSLTFTDEIDEEDLFTVIEGVKLVTDNFSASYLLGTDLDYVETLQGAGFKFSNPNAKRTCGCGSSFSV